MPDAAAALREVREALRPFAEKASRYEGHTDEMDMAFRFTVGDLRRARSALSALDGLSVVEGWAFRGGMDADYQDAVNFYPLAFGEPDNHDGPALLLLSPTPDTEDAP